MIIACICKPSCPEGERKKFAIGVANSIGGKITGALWLRLSKDDCSNIYHEHIHKSFYSELERCMTHGITTIYTIDCDDIDWERLTAFKTSYRKKHGLKKDCPDNWVHCPDTAEANNGIIKVYKKNI